MAATMRDVAQKAGVSLATVSYVVNHGPRPVSDELRVRVLGVMRELGYAPAPRGRTRRRPLSFGALVPDATNSFFATALCAAQEVLREHGHLLMMTSSGDDPDQEREQLQMLRRAGIEGLLFTPCGVIPPATERLARGGMPVVLMDRDGGSQRLTRVTMDNYQSAFRAVRVLADCGHERIGLINGPEHVCTAAHRLRGYIDALALARLPLRPEYMRCGPFHHEFGRQAARALMSLPERPHAIFSSSAIFTAGLVEALHELGLRWPDDVALIGFGDAPWAAFLTPPLTIIDQPSRELGGIAARLLLEGGSGRPEHVVLDSRLIVRESHWKVSRPQEVAS